MFLLISLINVSFIASCASNAPHPSLRPHRYNPGLAIKQLNAILQENPEDAEAHFQLGIVYSIEDSVSLAFKHFEKSVEYDPSPKRISWVDQNLEHNYMKHFCLGKAAIKDGNYEHAVYEFKIATSADPRKWEAFYQLAITYIKLGSDNFNRAKQALEEARNRATGNNKEMIEQLLENPPDSFSFIENQ